MDYLKAEYLVNYGEWSSEFSGTDMCNLGMDITEERNFENNHCRCLKYIEIRNPLQNTCTKKKEMFSFPNCKRVQGACMNSKCFMSFLSPRWRSLLCSNIFTFCKCAEDGCRISNHSRWGCIKELYCRSDLLLHCRWKETIRKEYDAGHGNLRSCIMCRKYSGKTESTLVYDNWLCKEVVLRLWCGWCHVFSKKMSI